jgi:hypothetical protein
MTFAASWSVSCAAKVIPPTSRMLMSPAELQCTCVKLTPEELRHVMLIGDGILADILKRLHDCNATK